MHPKNISISDFTYDLPDERIAKHPLKERDNSKLLVYKSDGITTSTFSNVADFLPENSLLIFNNTKVIEARLLFEKPSGGVIEIFCLEPDDQYADITTAMMQKGKVLWKCLVGGASKWKHGMKLQKKMDYNDKNISVEASIAERLSDSFVIAFSWQPAELSFAEMLHIAGFIPLPPYLNRQPEEEDKTNYQTIYARHDGSVAAPTAGLHFTENIFEKLAKKNIQKEFVTLHVGAGTFKPVKSEKMNEHEMHAEFIDVTDTAIQQIMNHIDDTIVAVGTTSLRTIESLYWIGTMIAANPNLRIEDLQVDQWQPYESEVKEMATKDALQNLLMWMKKNNFERLITRTQILIAPGYKMRVAKGIITNFHQPKSTLLLLVAAIIGSDWKKVYDYAMKNDFRFLSYGDGCLLWEAGNEATRK